MKGHHNATIETGVSFEYEFDIHKKGSESCNDKVKELDDIGDYNFGLKSSN